MKESNDDLLSLYLSECGQMLQSLEKLLIASDESESLRETAEIFRILHTLKGSSAMMEYQALSDMAHRFEDVLSFIKAAGHSLPPEYLTPFVDLGLAFCAFFRDGLTSVRQGALPKTDEKLWGEIDSLASALGVTQTNAPAIIEPALEGAEKPSMPGAIRVRVRLKSCPMPHIRALVVSKSIQGLCSFVATYPKDIGSAENGASIAQNGFLVDFLPGQDVEAAAVIRKLGAQPYVLSCTPEPSDPAAEERKPEDEDADPLQHMAVSQASINALLGCMEEIVSADNALEAYTEETGQTSRRMNELLSLLRRAIANADILASQLAMRDVGGVFLQMRRTVRGMSKELKKEIKLKTAGGDVLVDKSILEILSDSLIHMIRNAVDHGIETPDERISAGKPPCGLITLTAQKQNDTLTVTVSDDGAGVRREMVLDSAQRSGKLTKPKEQYTQAEIYELLLTSGISTKSEVTQFSGRGVGMDTVLRRVRQAGGRVSVESREGVGTTFRLKIPITLVMIDGITVTAHDGSELIIPANAILHITELRTPSASPGDEEITYKGLVYQELAFPGLPPIAGAATGGYAILLQTDYGAYYLRVQRISMMRTYYVKPLPDYLSQALGGNAVYAGCVLAADSALRCVLDIDKLLAAQKDHANQKGR